MPWILKVGTLARPLTSTFGGRLQSPAGSMPISARNSSGRSLAIRPPIVPAAEWGDDDCRPDLLQDRDDAGLDAAGDRTIRHQRREPVLVILLVERRHQIAVAVDRRIIRIAA